MGPPEACGGRLRDAKGPIDGLSSTGKLMTTFSPSTSTNQPSGISLIGHSIGCNRDRSAVGIRIDARGASATRVPEQVLRPHREPHRRCSRAVDSGGIRGRETWVSCAREASCSITGTRCTSSPHGTSIALRCRCRSTPTPRPASCDPLAKRCSANSRPASDVAAREICINHYGTLRPPTSRSRWPQTTQIMPLTCGDNGGRGRYRTADRWCVKPELYH